MRSKNDMFRLTIPAYAGVFETGAALTVSFAGDEACQIASLWSPGFVATRKRRIIDPATRTIDFNLSFSIVLPESCVK